jgi:hypothetical protein
MTNENPIDPLFVEPCIDGPYVDRDARSGRLIKPPVESYGVEFARFRIAGDLTIRILTPAAGDPEGVRIEVLLGAQYHAVSGEDVRTSTVAFLTKARARAVGSAIMGAAAEL